MYVCVCTDTVCIYYRYFLTFVLYSQYINFHCLSYFLIIFLVKVEAKKYSYNILIKTHNPKIICHKGRISKLQITINT